MMFWIICFAIMGIAVLLMSLGVILGRSPLKGSCGGLGNAGVSDQCDFCGKRTKDCPRKP